jgi:hypothetical protein
MGRRLLTTAMIVAAALLAKSWVFTLAVQSQMGQWDAIPASRAFWVQLPFIVATVLIAIRIPRWTELPAHALIAGVVAPATIALIPSASAVTLGGHVEHVVRVWIVTGAPLNLLGWLVGLTVLFAMKRAVQRARFGASAVGAV